MLLLRRSVFLHIPKTGGDWVRAALRNAGVLQGLPRQHSPDKHLTREESIVARGNRRPFCFVRHPLSWLESFWRYSGGTTQDCRKPREYDWRTQNANGRAMLGPVCDCYDPWFDRFIEKVTTMRPGYVGWLYSQYVTPNALIGRTEKLSADLIACLHEAGEEFSMVRIQATPRVNQSVAPRPTISRRLLQRVECVESQVLETYYS